MFIDQNFVLEISFSASDSRSCASSVVFRRSFDEVYDFITPAYESVVVYPL